MENCGILAYFGAWLSKWYRLTVASLIVQFSQPIVSISQPGATARKLASGDMVEIVNAQGRVAIRCEVDQRVRPGCVAIEAGYWVSEFVEGDLYSLINDTCSPTALTYPHNDVLVELTKL